MQKRYYQKGLLLSQFREYVQVSQQHRSYLINQDGLTYSHHQQEMNEKKQTFSFSKKDIIIVKVDLIKFTITWINQQTQQKFKIELDKQESDYYPCVHLIIGSATIIDNF